MADLVTELEQQARARFVRWDPALWHELIQGPAGELLESLQAASFPGGHCEDVLEELPPARLRGDRPGLPGARCVASCSASAGSCRSSRTRHPSSATCWGGWQLNGIFQTQTGFPFTVIDPVTDIRFLTNRPDVVCDPNKGAPQTAQKWFNTECFVRRTLAQTGERSGNEGRNIVRGRGFTRTDLSLFKNIRIHKGHQLQLRIEAFNLFNEVRFGPPGFHIGTPTFGAITSADEGRIVQLGVKYVF